MIEKNGRPLPVLYSNPLRLTRASYWTSGIRVINVLLACLLWVGAADAEPSECTQAYEGAQVMRAEGQLRAAQRQLQECVRPGCPEFARADCGRWLGELEAAMPSIVLLVKRGATELENVEVVFDDQPLVSRIDGKAIPVDPGRHVLRFVHQGNDPLTIEVLLREGDKNRLIAVNFPDPQSARAAGTATSHRPVQAARRHSALPYVLAGVGALGVAGFVTLGLLGNGDRRELEHTCSPRCSQDEIGAVRTKYRLADVSLLLGALAFGGAGYLVFSSPSTPAKAAASPHLHVSMAVLPQAAFGTARLSF
jgi:hypothetical protein